MHLQCISCVFPIYFLCTSYAFPIYCLWTLPSFNDERAFLLSSPELLHNYQFWWLWPFFNYDCAHAITSQLTLQSHHPLRCQVPAMKVGNCAHRLGPDTILLSSPRHPNIYQFTHPAAFVSLRVCSFLASRNTTEFPRRSSHAEWPDSLWYCWFSGPKYPQIPPACSARRNASCPYGFAVFWARNTNSWNLSGGMWSRQAGRGSDSQ